MKKLPSGLPIWRLAFRPFFLGGAIFGVFAIAWWGLFRTGHGIAPEGPFSPTQWHGHEMLFGFGMAIVYGFALTAVQSWTDIPGVKGVKLMILWGVWMLARISWLIPTTLSFWLAVFFDLSFHLLALSTFLIPVIARRQWSNIVFAGIPLMILFINALYYSAAYRGDYLQQQLCLQAVIWLFALIISVIGGRVIPYFAANRLDLTSAPPIYWLEYGSYAGILLLAVDTLIGKTLNPPSTMLIATVVSILHFSRLWRWWLPGVSRIPLLWSLYLFYAFIPLFIFSWGIASYLNWLPGDVLHLLSVGAISGMILSMISRVSSGHTGREIKSGPAINIAFVMIAVAASLRFGTVLFHPGWRITLQSTSAILWVVAFSIFIWSYFKILITTRIDGENG